MLAEEEVSNLNVFYKAGWGVGVWSQERTMLLHRAGLQGPHTPTGDEGPLSLLPSRNGGRSPKVWTIPLSKAPERRLLASLVASALMLATCPGHHKAHSAHQRAGTQLPTPCPRRNRLGCPGAPRPQASVLSGAARQAAQGLT